MEAAVLLTGLILIFVIFAFCGYMIFVNWQIFKKAGKPGWASIVPIYSNYILTEITWGNGIWFLLGFAAIVPIFGGLVASAYVIITTINLGKAFGKDTGFILGLIFLGPIFYSILAFDKKCVYLGPENNVLKVKPGDVFSGNANTQSQQPQYQQPVNVVNNQESVTVNNTVPNVQASFCSSCGTKLDSGTIFCPNCGKKVN